jgi:predicted  nucleic acid-binding Zn-ribbon protein
MDSSVDTRQTDSNVNPALSTQEKELVARADERLVHAYEQIARADEELARFNEQISRLEKVKKIRQPSRGRPALRGLIGLLLTAGICTAAFAWHSYGETARPMISRWAPQLAASSLPSETPKLADQQSPPAVQLAAADPAVTQLPAPAQIAPQDAAAAAIAAEHTQLLQTMARGLASVQQEIEQLKASQAELARESAKTAEQLKANQEQMARAIANASEQNLRPRISAATSAAPSAATAANPPRPVANPARKPVSTLPATQARAQARAPVQLQPRQQ